MVRDKGKPEGKGSSRPGVSVKYAWLFYGYRVLQFQILLLGHIKVGGAGDLAVGYGFYQGVHVGTNLCRNLFLIDRVLDDLASAIGNAIDLYTAPVDVVGTFQNALDPAVRDVAPILVGRSDDAVSLSVVHTNELSSQVGIAADAPYAGFLAGFQSAKGGGSAYGIDDIAALTNLGQSGLLGGSMGGQNGGFGGSRR